MAQHELPFYRPNVTDLEQTVLETAVFEDGIPVHQVQERTVVIQRGRQGATQNTMNRGFDIRENNGVIMNNDDKPGFDFVELIGRP